MTDQKPRKALFVCTGNSCRSVMAEYLMGKLSADSGRPWEVASAGVAAERYFSVPEQVYKVLEKHKIGRFEHVAQLIGRDLLSWSDLTLTMTEEHRDHIIDLYPEFTGKVHVLRDYVGMKDLNIEDPIGQSEELYDACCTKIKESIDALIQKNGRQSDAP